MRRWSAALVVSWMLIVPTVAMAAEVSFEVDAPKFPTPYVTSVWGLTLTAIAVIGARTSLRSPNMMMYMVLGSLALTAVMVSYSDRVHDGFQKAGLARLAELERAQQADKPK